MGLHNAYDLYARGEARLPQKFGNAVEGILTVYAEGAPTDEGYAPGCLRVDITSKKTYQNVGTITTAVWERLAPVITEAATLHVSKGGNDTTGDGSSSDPFLTLTAAFAAVDADNMTIIVHPGEYDEAAALAFPVAYNGLRVAGMVGEADATVITAATGPVITIDPAARSGTYWCSFSDLTIEGDATANVGLHIDNGTCTKKVIVSLRNVNIGMDDDQTDVAIQTVHSDDTANAIRIYHSGAPNQIEGIVALEVDNNGDRYEFTGINFEGPIHFGNGAVAGESRFMNCIVQNDGAAGDEGNDAQFLAAINCISRDGTTFAIVDKEDFGTNISTNFTALPAS